MIAPLGVTLQLVIIDRYLHVGSNNLSGDLPTNISTLTNIQSLRFEGNQFTGSLPVEVTALTTLVYVTVQ